ncbi:primosomal protein N' [Idiomarina xiamenensis]|nr:primosomal protein N' [Idiomarina xiamenensis]
MTADTRIIRVALPVPLAQLYDYDLPLAQDIVVGARLRVPFGQRQLVGICMADQVDAEGEFQRKPALAVIDDQPLWPQPIWQLLNWAAGYYCHALGDALAHAMPVLLRKGEAAAYQSQRYYRLSEAGEDIDINALKRAPQQQRLLNALRQGPLSSAQINATDEGFSAAALRALQEKGWVHAEQRSRRAPSWQLQQAEAPLPLNKEQAIAVAAINRASGAATYLLEGVTGSGKTEVYLQAMAEVLARGQQVLLLVPEIGLTPQTLARMQARFAVPIVMLHSGLTDRERLDAWLDARDGGAAIVVGTRSAIFTPCQRLGMIIIDEEHDASFKQQDGFRYNARDLAVKRAQLEQVPLLLGSATPSLESLENARQQRYHWLQLKQRAGGAKAVKHRVIDLKQQPLEAGLSTPLLTLMQTTLDKGEQVLLFLNRRGYAPALMCHECGWLAQCPRCDAYFTVHQQLGLLQCHHCGTQRPLPRQCHDCGSTQLVGRGVGTEQLEQVLSKRFPDHPVLRIDRDSTRRKGELDKHLQAATEARYPILLGTQMLAKGHHFPQVTLVALLDVDAALYSADFRAPERLGQLYTQVAGRAGRAEKAGMVVLQTHHPEHDLIQDLINNGYGHFALTSLQERQQAALPPCSHLALFRAEGMQREQVIAALDALSAQLPTHPQVQVLGPLPALMERKAGRYRYQLLLQCEQRAIRQQLLQHVLPTLARLPELRKVRWSLDIDPQDFS